MKIFTAAVKVPGGYMTNSILLGDKDQAYMNTTSLIHTQDKQEALLTGIKRGIIFQRNNKPLYCRGPVYIVNEEIEMDRLQKDKLMSLYIHSPLQILRDNLSEKEVYYQQVSHSQADIYARNHVLIHIEKSR